MCVSFSCFVVPVLAAVFRMTWSVWRDLLPQTEKVLVIRARWHRGVNGCFQVFLFDRNGLSFVWSCKEQDRHQQIFLFLFFFMYDCLRWGCYQRERQDFCTVMWLRWECGARMFIICVSDESVANRRISVFLCWAGEKDEPSIYENYPVVIQRMLLGSQLVLCDLKRCPQGSMQNGEED